jgi:hypothetical protein
MFRDGLRIGGIDRRSGGAWSNGDLLAVQDGTIVAGSGSGHFGTATIDFGATYVDTGEVVVTGQAWVTGSSHLQSWMQGDDSTADSSASEHEFLAASSVFIVTDRVVGVGFTVRAFVEPGYAQGDFTVHWEGS